MTQEIKALAAKFHRLSLTPVTRMVKERTDL